MLTIKEPLIQFRCGDGSLPATGGDEGLPLRGDEGTRLRARGMRLPGAGQEPFLFCEKETVLDSKEKGAIPCRKSGQIRRVPIPITLVP